MQRIRDWAIDLVKRNEKDKLLDLLNILAVIPTLRELKEQGFSIWEFTEDDLKELCDIAEVQVGSLKIFLREDWYSALGRGLNDLREAFRLKLRKH
jgi:hypothetical protein